MADIEAVALVTGGARRIGAAIVRDLVRNGFAVAVHCHGSLAEAGDVVAAVEAEGGRCAVLAADLEDTGACADLVERAGAALGPVRLLVNNASVFEDDNALTPDWTLWDRHFALHVKAPVALTAALARQLPDAADGLVVNIIDQRVWKLTPQFFSYTLSKSALWTATRTLAQAHAPRLRVNAIGPGPTLANTRQDADDFAAQISALPLRKSPMLTEFGRTIRYFWDTPSLTGQMVALDGGQHLAWQTADVAGIRE
ncbi:SDR family oxidoreductase [Mesorhizobium xinjiangense]|uniref:SDR family oxidoreductase n=1 Tax=Mesorhizobium xinjiangense TaxID=2678685 RepID=UPI0012EDE3CF|nr:SDR family oxidoreductase [Mesorhizobium xinjiangense]